MSGVPSSGGTPGVAVGSGGAGSGPPPTSRRLLAGLAIGLAGTIDVFAAGENAVVDPYVVVAEDGFYRLDLTGWVWLRLVVGAVLVASALALAIDRRATVLLAIGAGIIGMVAAVLLFAFQPVKETLSLLLVGWAVWLLIGLLRQRRRSGDHRTA